MTITQNLDKYYGLFADAAKSWDFFSGLTNYFSYVLKTPQLKKIVDREMRKRNTMFRKRDELENKTVQELREVKEKLLSIIEINKIDTKDFNQFASGIPNPREKGETILNQLKLFEEGRISISGYYSDNLEHYLFDIAANLLRLGYKEQIKDFIVSDEEYGYYCRQISGDIEGFSFGGNEYGNFVFSKKTRPLRFQQDRAIERARKLEPWGAFEALIKLWKARETALKDKNLREVLEDALSDKEYVFDAHDAADIAFAAEDINTLTKNNNADERELDFLKISKYRTLSASAHSYLLQNLVPELPDGAGMREALKRKQEQLRQKILNQAVEKMEQFIEKYGPVLERVEVFMKEHEPEKYKKEEAEKTEKLERITKEIEEIKREKNQNADITKIAIVSMPKLQVRNIEDNTLAKGKKRIHLPKFKPTDWAKITIRFLDERNVLITADKKELVPADYETLGFADEKRGKPNLAWVFFIGLAKNNGETKELPTPIPDSIKQQKRQLSDRLKTIFKNDTDPFYSPTDTRIYKIKINLIPPPSSEEGGERPDKEGIREYLKEAAPEVYDKDENRDYEE